MWVAKYRHNLSPLLKWGSHYSYGATHKLLAICSSEEQAILTQWQYFRVQRATQIEYAHSTNSPQHFLDLSNNSGDNERIDDCHRQTPAVKPHLCKAEQEEGPFSNPAYSELHCNSWPSSCCGCQLPLGLPGFRKAPWVSAKAVSDHACRTYQVL